MTPEVIAAVIWGVTVACGGAFLTPLTSWYYALHKPSWQPPDWLFGPAWSVILTAASVSAYLGWTRAPDSETRLLIASLFIVNGIANLLWSPLFFKLQRPDWALIEVPFLWLSILAPMVVLAPISGLASLLLLPYLLWVSFAAFLNLTIVRLNAPFGRQTMRPTPEETP